MAISCEGEAVIVLIQAQIHFTFFTRDVRVAFAVWVFKCSSFFVPNRPVVYWIQSYIIWGQRRCLDSNPLCFLLGLSCLVFLRFLGSGPIWHRVWPNSVLNFFWFIGVSVEPVSRSILLYSIHELITIDGKQANNEFEPLNANSVSDYNTQS